MICRELTLTSTDGVPLFVREYVPTPSANGTRSGGEEFRKGDRLAQRARGLTAVEPSEIPSPTSNRSDRARRTDSQRYPTLMISHGLGEHGGRYPHVAEAACERGWRVIVGDHRGHGQSGGTRTHIRLFDRYARDLDLIWHHFRLDPAQTVLLGHSMGGLIGIRHLQLYLDRFAGLILSSPLLRVKVPINPVTLFLGKLLSYVAPKVRFKSKVKKYRLPDEANREANTDPANHRTPPVIPTEDDLLSDSVTAAWYFAMQRARRLAWEKAHRVRLPVMLMQAELDGLVDSEAAAPWVAQTKSRHTDCRVLADRYHEILCEPDWPDLLSEMLDWGERVIRRRTPKPKQERNESLFRLFGPEPTEPLRQVG